jgi:hypothetical protein
MTLIEEAEAMIVRLEAMYSHRGDSIATQRVNPDGDDAAALLRRMIEQMRGEGV